MATKRDYYEVLGIDRNASTDDIKKAYRKLAVKFHPDRNPDNDQAEENFKEATEAYEVLGDDQRKRVYDQFGHEGVASGAGGFQGFRSAADFEDLFSGFSDIFGSDFFESFFGAGDIFGRTRTSGRRERVVRGSDIRYDITLTLEEAAFGKKVELELEREESCKDCSGTGARAGSSPVTCDHCGGTGQVTRTQGFFTVASTCPTCRGSGRIIKDHCPTCRGRGTKPKSRKIVLDVEPGIEDSTVLRLRGEGNAGPKGGPHGDLIVVVHQEQHQKFLRQGNNVLCEIPVSVYQAILGTDIKVPTLDGKMVKINIPPGTQSGRTFRLKKEGIPYLKRWGKGDQLVKIIVRIPKNLSSSEKKLLQQIRNEVKELDAPDLLPVSKFE